jgi:HEAT repeats
VKVHMKKMAIVALLFAAACGHHMPPDEAMANLNNPDAKVRSNAADALRTENGVPPNAIPLLVQSVQKEGDPHAKAAMMITLGKSGDPQVKPMIDAYVQQAQSEEERRWAGRALKYWMLQTGQIPADYVFPKGWPYGQPGYPP